MFETPILFLIFNRPDVTAQVFEEIQKQKPKYLYVAADGARANNGRDVENCKLTRTLVVDGIDWDCEVKTLFRDENLGCGIAVSDAITWFFENVEQGIILEDDCLPHFSFFSYCELLLERYKDDQNIFSISGNNFQNRIKRGHASYYFSNYSHNWGWASWRRAWNHYDHNLSQLAYFKSNNRISKIDNRTVFSTYWLKNFEDVKKEAFTHIWDSQWMFAMWNAGGMAILPNVNLISNIGFGRNATHTLHKESVFANMRIDEIGPIIHPKSMRIDSKADLYTTEKVFNIVPKYSLKNIKRKLMKIIKAVKKSIYLV